MEKSQRKNKNSIDELPDALLISILSLLPTKESARTSVLARRWQNLWLHTTTLNFDASETLLESTRQKVTEARRQASYPLGRNHVKCIVQKMLETEKAAFVRGLDAALNSHLSMQTLDEFRVGFNLDISNSADIDRWIASALAKKVKRLELDFTRIRNRFIKYSNYVKYEFPNAVQNFETLVSLSLTEVRVDEGVLDSFLRNCPSLEELCLKDCSGFQSLNLKGESSQLKSVTMDQCEGLAKLEIRSTNLASLTFHAMNPTSVWIDIGVSSLVRLSLGAESSYTPKLLSNWLFRISGSLANLQMLTLRTPTFRQGDDEELKFPDLPKLRTLVISNMSRYVRVCEGSLLCFTDPLLNAAPLLHKLVMKFKSLYRRRGAAPARRIRHRNLKELVVESLKSEAAVVAEIALYVLENASSLEKMIIDGKVVTGVDLHLFKLKHGTYKCS